MRAMVLERPAPVGTKPLKAMSVPDPIPGPGEVRIHVAACGLCRTDLHQVEGELPMRVAPVIPGHQIVGIIDRLGFGAGSRFRIGDRVGVPWLHSACGSCVRCDAGLENLCPRARFTGYDLDGGYAEYALAPEAFVLALPPGVADFQVAPLLCAGIIGYRALRLSGVRQGEVLGLYGFGAAAHISLQVARFWGCPVYVFTRTEEHRTLARRLGAEWAGAAEESPPRPPARAIIFAPAGRLVPEALRAVEPGGVVALAGIYMDDIPPLDYTKHLYMEKTLRSVTAATRQDANELLALAARIPIRTEVEVFPLEQANEALQRLKRSEIRGAAVLAIGS